MEPFRSYLGRYHEGGVTRVHSGVLNVLRDGERTRDHLQS